MSDLTPPGWYEDPYGTPGLMRWWDGREWTEAAPPAGRGALPWLLAAGSGVLVIVAVVVATLFVLRDEGGGGGERGTSTVPVPPSPANRSAVTGTVIDASSGLSYARLGSPWTAADSGWLRPDLFSAGEVSVVQSPFEQYASFNATSLSGVPRTAESSGYTGPRDLPAVGRRVTARILTEHFAMAKTRTTLSSAARTVGGHRAWLERFRLDFTEARSRGWKFTADTVAILIVDRGDRRLGELWVSVPDSFPDQGDLDQVLDSVTVS
ncbi:DUF2510 domain-containing protein [Actinomadura sp. DC4]|uniref:DUF2510 domain-containing protein n=1 Tax=Actinomadura sp. DC4 TaxID=3055069 RepID=UPI0025AF86D8|nr:DUF2510 domain-containing protein [Actinomadura sp. DC4]MDN3356196.1 DUF2510 domain-containing protein [Actinomadura sp. DC4]